MNDTVTVIDIVASVTDETESGTRSAEANVSKLEKSIMNLYKQIQGMKGKSKLEIAATLKDMASKGIQNVAAAGKKIAGKVWTVTLKAVDLVTAPFKKVWGLISNPMTQMAAFAGISFGLADTVNTFMDFESAMAQVKATMAPSAKSAEILEADMCKLEEAARSMGASTKFSATQAAEALNYMALAGYDTETSIAMLPNVLNLAAAGGLELATASDMVTDAQSALGLTLEQTETLIDQMAMTSSKTNTSVGQLGDAILEVGGNARKLAGGTTELNTVLGVLADNGIKGAEGGTHLRNVILSLSAPTDKAAKKMKSLGIQAFDAEGKLRSLPEVFTEMSASLSNLTDQERTQALSEMFNTTDLAAVNYLLGTSAERYNELAEAIDNADGSASIMAKTMEDTLGGSLTTLQSAASEVQISIGKKLSPYIKGLVDWVTAHMPDIQTAVGNAVDFVTGKIDSVIAAVKSLTGSQEWQNAETLWDKIQLAWDKLIAEPFDAWWGSTGKTWLADKANSIGEGLGTALKTGILALLGVDVSGAAADGIDIGKSFFDGFMKGFEWDKVAEALGTALKDGLKFLFKDAATLLPGGTEASGTSLLSAGALGYGAFKTYQTAKPIINGVKGAGRAIANISGITEGMNLVKAAKSGGDAAQSALAFAQNGALGKGIQLGTKLPEVAAKAGKFATKAAPVLAGVTSAIQMGVDAYHGTQKAEEWTGSNSTGNKVASGIGAAVGGLGDGILGDESIVRKASNVGGGALKGAGIGAAVGSILPGVGTAIGAGVGAGIGAAGAAIGGSNIAKALSTAGGAIKGFFTETVPEKFGQFAEGAKGFFTESVPNALGKAKEAVGGFFTETVPTKFGELKEGVAGFFTEKVGGAINTAKEKVTGFFTETIPQKFSELKEGIAGFFTEKIGGAITAAKEKVSGFFTETVPEKFNEFKDGLASLFTEKIPYALGYAAGKVTVFFTETVPEKFDELVTGVTNFFTETVPNALSAVGSALTTFFTETVPAFFSDLWDGVVGFFTETVPAALETVGAALTTFFTESVPQFFSELWDGVTGFFTETVMPAVETVGATVTTFFTETVPQFFNNLVAGITGFFTETVQPAIETVGNAISTFFTETVPEFFGNLVDGVTTFFTETVPGAIETVGEAVSTFFTETVPEFFSNLFDGVVNFFTEAVPNAISSIGESIGNFFSNIGEKISGFFGGLWDSVTGNASAGYQAATAHAEGGIMTSPHVGLVAEDGAEAIIPLSNKRRDRGIDLWEQAGDMLGVKPYAEGGIVGNAEPAQSAEPIQVTNQAASAAGDGAGGNMTVPVTIENLTFEINVSGGETPDAQALVDTIRENVRGMTDEIAYQLAVAMKQSFANTPKEQWG